MRAARSAAENMLSSTPLAMMARFVALILPALVLVGGASEFADVAGCALRGSELHFTSAAGDALFRFALGSSGARSVAPNASMVIASRTWLGRCVYGCDEGTVAWARVAASRDEAIAALVLLGDRSGTEALWSVSSDGGLAAGSVQPVHSERLDDSAARAIARSRTAEALAPARRALQLQVESAPPYGRLDGCPAGAWRYEIGLILDAGFVSAQGGAGAALALATLAVEQSAELFLDQLGVHLYASRIILNEEAGGVFAQTGPNEAPEVNGLRTCEGYTDLIVTGSRGVQVHEEGPSIALGRLAAWIGAHAPAGPRAWVLLTNCFPSITGEGSFIVGKAAANAGCYAGSSPVYFEDSGVPYDPDSPEPCVEIVESGNCARAFGDAAAGACAEFCFNLNGGGATAGR